MSSYSIPCHWPTWILLCQYHTVCVTIILQHNLKSGMLIPPDTYLLFNVAAVILYLIFSYFHMRFKIIFSNSMKNCLEILMGIALNVQIAFHNINPIDPWIVGNFQLGLTAIIWFVTVIFFIRFPWQTFPNLHYKATRYESSVFAKQWCCSVYW